MMAGVEALTVKAKEIPLSTVMAGMGGNGVEFGIQLSGTGNRWYTAPAPVIHGMLLKPSYTEEDLLGYLGDSCVTEVYGLGGMSSIAGPAYARFTGATFAEAKSVRKRLVRFHWVSTHSLPFLGMNTADSLWGSTRARL